MDHIQYQNKPLDFRLSYFSSPKSLIKVGRYTVSPSLSSEVESHNRKVQQLSLDCDCACLGRK